MKNSTFSKAVLVSLRSSQQSHPGLAIFLIMKILKMKTELVAEFSSNILPVNTGMFPPFDVQYTIHLKPATEITPFSCNNLQTRHIVSLHCKYDGRVSSVP